MKIANIQFINNSYIQNNNKVKSTPVQKFAAFAVLRQPRDIFVKSMPAGDYANSVNFTGAVQKTQELFEVKFPKSFFQKLIREEDIPDAYTGITLIPNCRIPFFKQMGIFGINSSAAVSELRNFRGSMFPIEKEIFKLLEAQSKKHPDLNLQELLKLKYPQAEKTLITQQANILNKIHFIIRQLPQKEYQPARMLLIKSFDQIFEPNPIPERRFSRKNFLRELHKIEINDEKIKKRVLEIAGKLPQSTNSINAFIVKYSQPYKLRYNNKTGDYTRIKRDSVEIGTRLLEPSVGTVDHIHPQAAYRAENKARKNGDETAKDLSTYKVTVLTSKKINEEKGNIPLDDFIKISKYDIPNNIQKHFDVLTHIAEKQAHNGKIKEAAQLADYILVLKNEFELRSNIVKPDLNGFEGKAVKIREKLETSKLKQQKKKNRLKKTGHADNSHSEQYYDKAGHLMENRKVHKFSSRYHQ